MKKLNLLIVGLLSLFSLHALSVEFTSCEITFNGDYETLQEKVNFTTFILTDNDKNIILRNPKTKSVIDIYIVLFKKDHQTVNATHAFKVYYKISNPDLTNNEAIIEGKTEISGYNSWGFSVSIAGDVASLNFSCKPMELRKPGYIFRDLSFMAAPWFITPKDK